MNWCICAAKLGNEEQKLKYLPSLARFDSIGCWVWSKFFMVLEIKFEVIAKAHASCS